MSTNQRGSTSRVTIPVHAGFVSAKTSPWARMTSSMRLGSVTKIRVRTTSAAVAPASSSAARMISRHRRAWPYASAGGSASPGMTGAVPLTKTRSPATTAREYPYRSSHVEPDEITRRSTGLVSRRVDALRQVESWDVGAAAVAVVGPDGVQARVGPHDRPLPWASVTKLATALAALVAAEEGAVDLDAP